MAEQSAAKKEKLELAMVAFRDYPPAGNYVVRVSPFTRDVKLFDTWMDRLDFVGGSRATMPLADALAAALNVCPSAFFSPRLVPPWDHVRLTRSFVRPSVITVSLRAHDKGTVLCSRYQHRSLSSGNLNGVPHHDHLLETLNVITWLCSGRSSATLFSAWLRFRLDGSRNRSHTLQGSGGALCHRTAPAQ